MFEDRERTSPVASTRTVFEAEAIAAALQARGINARVVDAANAALWSGTFGGAKVIVLEHDKSAAAEALRELRTERDSIDWDQVDVGAPGPDKREGESTRQQREHRRWSWTAAVLLMPIGFMLLAAGAGRGDPLLQMLGGALLVGSLVIAGYLFLPESRV
jgi:Putative prokaryotic signal transducing protein